MERRTYQRRILRRERLTTALLLKISLWALAVVFIASAVTFVATYQDARARVIALLHQDLAPTLVRNQQLFSRIEEQGEILTQEFLERYRLMRNEPHRIAQFDRWYVETSPGVIRLQPEFNRGVQVGNDYFQHLSAFIGPRVKPLDSELKTRVIAAQYTLDALGPAWQNVVGNTHFSMPENILVMYSTTAAWGLLADKELVITDFSVVKSTLQQQNPERTPSWTGLYYDISADVWTITYQRPIDVGGKHLANASFDVALDSLLTDLTAKKRANSEHMVLNSQADLIAASNLSIEAMKSREILTTQTYEELIYQSVAKIIKRENLANPPIVMESGVDGQLVIIDKIEGPNWWHVTLYPLAEIRSEAVLLPLRLVVAGVSLVLLILLITYWLIRREVTQPLQEVATIASMMGRSNYQQALEYRSVDIKARGEVKQAIDAFKTMASRFIKAQNELEQQVQDRTAALAEANRKLDALAHLDGLTGLFNRRAFDHDLAEALANHQSFYLMMADIDEFKPYNDNYGHDAGDRALRKIANSLNTASGYKVYRYGGEELAAILPAVSRTAVEEQLAHWRQAVINLYIEHEFTSTGTPFLTISMGAAAVAPEDTVEDIIRRTDKQLYAAKHAGRNRYVIES